MGTRDGGWGGEREGKRLKAKRSVGDGPEFGGGTPGKWEVELGMSTFCPSVQVWRVHFWEH
jgi:hypothetical protein